MASFPFVSDQGQSNSSCGFTPIWASALNIYPVTNANPFNPTTAQRDAA